MEPTNVAPTPDASPAPNASMNSSNLPSTWPGAFGIYKFSAAAVHRNIWLLVALWLTIIVASFAIGLMKLGVIGSLLSALLGAVLSVMLTHIFIAGVRGKHVNSNEIFPSNLPMLSLKMFGLSLLVGAVTIVSLLLFIIPFFFVFPRLRLAMYYLVDKDMGVFDAFTASWENTKGNVGKVWGIIGVEFLMFLPAFTIIGILLTLYWYITYSAANAVLYEHVSSKHA